METSSRLFNCALCACQAIICSFCDRNNIYCSFECAYQARIESLRKAGKRYQNSLRGRHKHASRQKRYRWRLANKVTHHSSNTSPASDLLSAACEPEKHPSEPTAGIICCSFCGKVCSPFVRFSFLHRQNERRMRHFSVWPCGP